jgi:hypothetical protein
MKVMVKTEAEIDISIEIAAQWFANITDDDQARFFVAVCEEAKKWKKGGLGPNHQWFQIGSHLKNCECSSEAARDMIREMYNGLQNGEH